MDDQHDGVGERDDPAAHRREAALPSELDEFEGGDPACWLQYVCTECGALVEGSIATPCWRCGAVRDLTV